MRAFLNAVAGMTAATIIAISLAGRSDAATIAFDFSGSSTTTVTVVGVAGGTMSFKLDLGPTDVSGNFNIEVFSGSSAVLASLSMAEVAGPAFDGITAKDHENITGRTDLQSEPLWNTAEWRVIGVNGDFPITLSINSVLASSLMRILCFRRY